MQELRKQTGLIVVQNKCSWAIWKEEQVLCGIADTIVHDELESIIISVLDVEVESSDFEDGRQIRKPD